MIAGLLLALGAALGTNLAFLFKQRGAVLAPPVIAGRVIAFGLVIVGAALMPAPVRASRAPQS